ncbi:acyl-homoserine-lactone synthase [Roseovarius sp. 2305UL8-3]|uniref:acyl-homoserine-lactone synthase n=1 Tax=Roseovarius conchicola TaxID=3121636 RepID=UPI0035286F27
MLRYVYGNDLADYPKLRDTMFRDRADQFKTRLNWAVNVDADGYERDEYDDLNPLYVIWETPAGAHGGSMRLLPTTGPTMVNDHFSHLTGGGAITSPLIWECTRFCLARDAGQNVAGALMLAGGEIMHNFGIEHYVGVFDARMERIYRFIGSSPEIIGQQGEGRDRISVGLWEFTGDARTRVARRAGLSLAISELWFNRAFGHMQGDLVKSA